MVKKYLILFLGILCVCQLGAASLSKHIVDYRIKAKLIPDEKAVEGEEVLTWLNDSEVPVSELQFHLYLNAFKNTLSTFMKESGGAHRGFKLDTKDWGYIEVKKIQIVDGADLSSSMVYIQPDDDNIEDQTVMKVDLPEPVLPQESITLNIEFYVKLPKVFARSGFKDDFFMVAQWFPKIGVFWEGEWNCHQYHSESEYFADFGIYEVEINIPDEFVVGATGERTKEVANGDGTTTYTYYQEDVHDFAWTACPDFVEFKERYTLDDPPVDTEITLLVHKSHLKFKERYSSSLKNGIEFYSQNYGAYPYSTITLVDPPPGASGAGGMEYPTLFTSITFAFLPEGIRLPEMVTIHEFGHGYWYGIVASNEFEEPWLDEGINSYSEIKAMDKYYGEKTSMINIGGIKLSDLVTQRLQVIAVTKLDPILKNSWEYYSSGSYGVNNYAKAAITLLTLENYLGEDVMSEIMRTYYQRWKFKHPRTEDFIEVAEDVSGQDLDWFFDQFFRSADTLDYAISLVRSREINEPEGLFDGQEEKGEQDRKDRGKEEKVYRNEVVVLRKGELVFPQEILIVFDDGVEIREKWDGRDRWKRFEYKNPIKLKFAQLDPENKILLDSNFVNNSRTLKKEKTFSLKHALEMMFGFQALLTLISQ